MSSLYQRIRPLLFKLSAERAHSLATNGLDLLANIGFANRLDQDLRVRDTRLHTKFAGLRLPNPVGLAAGFDKNGSHIQGSTALGFGFLEIGTVTPLAQDGNPKPRLFRLREDQAIINRMGFNNAGIDAVIQHLNHTRRKIHIGINLGKNKATANADAVNDYVQGIKRLGMYANYLVINISSPNTPNLRALSRREPLLELLQAVQTARADLSAQLNKPAPPVFVKLSPDEELISLDTTVQVALDCKVDGLITTNTTLERNNLRSNLQHEQGGLSGAPLRQRALDTLRYVFSATQGRIALIGVGGIDSAESAYERILAGANAVQLYTSLIYYGPSLIRDINRGLIKLLERDGFNSVTEAVGKG